MGKWTKEPWGRTDNGITHGWIPNSPDPESDPDMVLDLDDFDRASACVNAMKDIPDPARLVEAAKQLRSIVKCQRPMVNCEFATGSGSTVRLPPNLYCDHCKAINAFDQALAAKEATDAD